MGNLLQLFATCILLRQVLIQNVGVVQADNLTSPISVGNAGVVLTPTQNTFWVSPDNTFALGFLATPSSSRRSFTLSLYYSYLSQFHITPVWSPHRGHILTQDASLQITEQGGLSLFDSGTQIWHIDAPQKGVASLYISDEGNILLYGNDSSIIWQRWDEPITDTLLPGQSLYSGAAVVDSTGRYKLRMQTDSNFVLYFLGTLSADYSNPYWMSDTWNLDVTQAYYNASQGLVLLNNRIGHIVKVLLQSSPSSQLERIVLLESGTLTRYRLSSDGKIWSPVVQVPSSICYVLGLCGPYGVCRSNSNDMTNYTCTCPTDEFDYADANDWSMGCHTNYPLDCDQGSKLTKLPGLRYSVVLNSSTSSPTWAYQYYNALSTEDECAQLCNASCQCAAATHDGANCHLNTVGQLSSGNMEMSTSVTYLKTSVNPGNGNNVKGRKVEQVLSTGAVVGISVTLGLACIVGCANLAWWYHRSRSTEAHMTEGEDELPLLEGGPGPVHFSYKELKAASNGFTNLLGRGGFGPVYKGVLAGGAIVAIKKLEGSTYGEKQFRAEVITIGSVHHMNLVRLRGYCAKGPHRMLVYEFMPKGSLDSYIFHDDDPIQLQNQVLLNWESRFQILLSTARAIRYLHEECQPHIVHCDIKPENILLDEAFNAKVSDFGMAQLVGGEAGLTGSITRVRGTIGYMAPEWMSSKHITTKADVYSFGIVLLEVISGRRAIDTNADSVSKMDLSTWAYSQVMEHCAALAILDPRISNISPLPTSAHATALAVSDVPNYVSASENYAQHDVPACPAATSDSADVAPEFLRAVLVALWCIHKDPSIRPSMGLVVQILEGIVPVQTPPYPF